MIEYVLITVKYREKMFLDMELPAQIEIPVLIKMLLDALQTAEPQLFSPVEDIKLKHKGNIVEKGTLYDNKIWDGSIVEIV